MSGTITPRIKDDEPTMPCDGSGPVDQLCINPFANGGTMEKMDDAKSGLSAKSEKMQEEMEMAQWTFFMVAFGQTAMLALDTFRYKSASTYYDAGSVLGTNWWKMSNQLSSYSGLVLWGLATITQLLSMLDWETGVIANLVVWTIGLGQIGMLLSTIAGFMNFYAYNSAFGIKEDSSRSTADVTNATAVFAATEQEMLEKTVNSVGVSFAIYQHAEAWAMAQVYALGDDMVKEKMPKKGAEMSNKMFSIFGAATGKTMTYVAI